MKALSQNSTFWLSIGTLALSFAMPLAETSAQDRSLRDRILEEHRERRAGILNGIGEAFSNFFEPAPSYRSERRDYDPRYDPDHIYESRRPAARQAPSGWDAPFPPPSDLVTPRDRYDIYRQQQLRLRRPEPLREWRPEAPQVREPVPTNQPLQRQPVVEDRNRQYYDRPEFFENLPGASGAVTAPAPAVQETVAPQRDVIIPEGARESRRIGSRVLSPESAPVVASTDQIAPPPIPMGASETIGSARRDAEPPSRVIPEPTVIGSQSSTAGIIAIPLTSEYSTSSGGTVTLGDLLEGNQAVMIDFWATWSGESMASFSNLNILAAEMQALGIAVVGMNFDGNADTVERVRRAQDLSIPWLMEPRSRPFSRDMEISALPHRLLIDAAGVVRFSGDPDDDALRQAIDGIVNGGLDRIGR